jgi:hypothetical protein
LLAKHFVVATLVDLCSERVVPAASVEIEISAPDRGYAGILAELGRSNAASLQDEWVGRVAVH